ncbi:MULTISPECIES: universal stress protein [Saccharopolyspora]|uniref:UspA domain-containing protein n=1 Tax=Saccharopolyspora gregorii TaxID=33914 RepID=A0ABP6S0B7_9PSEU|nr:MULTISPECIES: universal stress protein [Saccharopolyspora]MCA1188397.1 universal stress protein [Saccharopolyspora sp. 6T]MCA1194807.1 universal stress protein [Saccharopolyspora sp. 6V]MCA1228259.1 universal stress protein [Saccharopolyspora sp. 6M]MCA1281291.1 universal stress protein [Saccharopolyspora sp. 7B]
MERTVQQVEVDGGVAVGLDGSPSSLRALDVAAHEAELRSAVLHVVRAWSMRTAPRPADCPPGAVPSMDAYQRSVDESAERIVRDRLGAEPRIPVQRHIAHSPSPQALLSASRGADLLVVGHRGRGGFAGLLLGSVAEQCVRHAACPVLVVRPAI